MPALVVAVVLSPLTSPLNTPCQIVVTIPIRALESPTPFPSPPPTRLAPPDADRNACVRVMSVQVPVVSVYLHVAAGFVLFLTLELIASFLYCV